MAPSAYPKVSAASINSCPHAIDVHPQLTSLAVHNNFVIIVDCHAHSGSLTIELCTSFEILQNHKAAYAQWRIKRWEGP